jgi:hypothetical protein
VRLKDITPIIYIFPQRDVGRESSLYLRYNNDIHQKQYWKTSCIEASSNQTLQVKRTSKCKNSLMNVKENYSREYSSSHIQ